ncbi:akirin-1-like [Pelodytes ibericus]
MACGATLKRSMEFEALLSPQSPKRRRCAPLPGSPATPNAQRCGLRPETQPGQQSPIPQLGGDRRLTPEQIFHNLKQEYSRYQRRRQLEGTFNHIEAGSSNEVHASCSALTAPASPGSMGKKEQPTFSLRQVGALCERLLKDHEDKIREEYEQILNTKLEEQYESFVKFTQDQIMRRYGARPASYHRHELQRRDCATCMIVAMLVLTPTRGDAYLDLVINKEEFISNILVKEHLGSSQEISTLKKWFTQLSIPKNPSVTYQQATSQIKNQFNPVLETCRIR